MRAERLFIAIISLGIMGTGCKLKRDPNKKIDMISNPNIKLHDTAFEKYYAGTLFSPHVVRLDNGSKPAFIQVDSSYFGTKSLDKDTRDAYYKKVLTLLPKDELEVHRRIWAIAEVRAIQQGTGGAGTILSSIREVLDAKSGYYLVDMKRNDIEQLNPLNGIAGFRIRLRPLVIEVGDESGYYVSLESWKSSQKQ